MDLYRSGDRCGVHHIFPGSVLVLPMATASDRHRHHDAGHILRPLDGCHHAECLLAPQGHLGVVLDGRDCAHIDRCFDGVDVGADGEDEPPPLQAKGKSLKLTNRVYDTLKPVATTALPALGGLYLALAGIWHLPDATQVTETVAAVNVALGLLLHLSSATYSPTPNYAGTLTLVPGEDGSAIRLTSVDPVALTTQNEVIFKVNQPPMTSTPPPPMDPRLLNQ